MAIENDTTPPGVSPSTEAPPAAAPETPPAVEPAADTPPPRPLSRREEVMARVVESHRESLIKDGVELEPRPAVDPDADVDDTGPIEGAEPPPTDAAVEPGDTPPVQPAAPAADPVTPPAGRKITLKVNGQDVEMEEADVLRNAQLGLASTQKFQEAAALRRQAEGIIQRAQQMGVPLDGQQRPQPNPPAQAQPPAGAPPPQPATTLSKEDVARTLEAIQYGDKEQGTELFLDLLNKVTQGRAPSTTPQELFNQIAPAVAQSVLQKVEYDQALNQFGQEYAPIVNNAKLARLTADRVHEIRWQDSQAGIRRAEIDVFRQAGRETVETFKRDFGVDILTNGKPAAATPPTNGAPTLAQKQAAKDALPPTPSAATARAVLGQQVDQPKSASAVVNDMRRSRGYV